MPRKLFVYGESFPHSVYVPKRGSWDDKDLRNAATAIKADAVTPAYQLFQGVTGTQFLATLLSQTVAKVDTKIDISPSCRPFNVALTNTVSTTESETKITDVLEYCRKEKNSKDKDRVLRVSRRYIGVLSEKSTLPTNMEYVIEVDEVQADLTEDDNRLKAAASNRDKDKDGPNAETHVRSLAIFFDSNGGFRDHLSESSQFIKDSNAAAAVVAIRSRLDAACIKLYASSLNHMNRDDILFIVSDDELRKCGLALPYSPTIEEIVRFIGRNYNGGVFADILSLANHCVIPFGDNAVFYLNKDRPAGCSVILCPDFERLDDNTFMPAKFATYICAIVRNFLETSKFAPGEVEKALRLGLLAYTHSYETGISDNPFDPSMYSLAPSRVKRLADINLNKNDKEEKYLLSTMEFDMSAAIHWNRTDVYERCDPQVFSNLCRNIVRYGPNRAGRSHGDPNDRIDNWWPSPVITSPTAKFGRLTLINPVEIMHYRLIGRVIRNYFESSTRATPLCIAVFGKPGSGKSFGIKEIVKDYRHGVEKEPLVFNLAQFDSTAQLTESFHAIQSEVLASKEPPLILFDEFDSKFQTAELGWLKYFLAPMQDGQFRGRRGDYRIGRAIFLFAGGISHSFDFFRNNLQPDFNEQKWAKLPDFISRLHGHLDIKGINSESETGDVPRVVKLQRALVLRSILDFHKKDKIYTTTKYGENTVAKVTDDVIDWFLNQKFYRFGVRSMEAIVHAASVDDEPGFISASMPPRMQIDHHLEREPQTLAGEE